MQRPEYAIESLRSASNPVALFANGIGDNILVLPALRALARIFPERLTLVCNREARRIFFSELRVRAFLETRMWMEGNQRQFDPVSLSGRIENCDLLLSLVPWHSNSVRALLRLRSSTVSVGFFRDFHVFLPRNYDKHSADLAFDVPRLLDPSMRLERYAAPPRLPEAALRKAARIRKIVPRGLRVLVVHADTGKEKMWDFEKFTALLTAFLDRRRDVCVFAIGERMQPFDAERHQERIIPCFGLPLEISLALVAQADLFLGVDSCMLHAADFFRIPGVGLFGPTDSREFGFRVGPHRHVQGSRSMESIEPGAVLDALDAIYRYGRTAKRSGRPS